MYIYICIYIYVYVGREVNGGVLALKQVLKGGTGCKCMIGMIQADNWKTAKRGEIRQRVRY